MSLLFKIGQKPVIAALRRPDDLHKAIESRVDNIFFMGGTVKEIVSAVRLAREAKIGSFVHLDLIRGLSSTDKEAVDFIADYVGAEGIVTPKSHLIKAAKKVGMYGILHLFVLDSLALDKGLKMMDTVEPDGIELMPGVVTKVIQRFSEASDHIPIIASGLIQTKQEAIESLQAGATALSVSNPKLWSLSFEEYNRI